MNASEIKGAEKIHTAEYLVKHMTEENGFSKFAKPAAKIWTGGEKVRIYFARKQYVEINDDGSLIICGHCYRVGPEFRAAGFTTTAI